MMFVGCGSDNILVPTGQNGTHPMQLIPASAVGNIDSQVAYDPGWHGRHSVASYLAMKNLSAVDVFYFWIDHPICSLHSERMAADCITHPMYCPHAMEGCIAIICTTI